MNTTNPPATLFVTHAHEVAHLFCGHLGAAPAEFWEDRGKVSHSAQEMEARKDSQPGKESPPESRCRAQGESKRTKSANPKDSSGTRQPPLPPANDPQSKYDAAQEALALAFEGLFDLPERKAQHGFLHARARDEPTPEP